MTAPFWAGGFSKPVEYMGDAVLSSKSNFSGNLSTGGGEAHDQPKQIRATQIKLFPPRAMQSGCLYHPAQFGSGTGLGRGPGPRASRIACGADRHINGGSNPQPPTVGLRVLGFAIIWDTSTLPAITEIPPLLSGGNLIEKNAHFLCRRPLSIMRSGR